MYDKILNYTHKHILCVQIKISKPQKIEKITLIKCFDCLCYTP